MPVKKHNTLNKSMHHFTYESFMPINDLDLLKFKEHIDYLYRVKEDIEEAQKMIFVYFSLFEAEYKAYFHNTDEFKYSDDVAYDMDAIINILDVMDFAYLRLKDVKRFVHKRIILLYAIALIRAYSMWNQSYEESLNQLDVDKKYYEEILEKIEVLENTDL